MSHTHIKNMIFRAQQELVDNKPIISYNLLKDLSKYLDECYQSYEEKDIDTMSRVVWEWDYKSKRNVKPTKKQLSECREKAIFALCILSGNETNLVHKDDK